MKQKYNQQNSRGQNRQVTKKGVKKLKGSAVGKTPFKRCKAHSFLRCIESNWFKSAIGICIYQSYFWYIHTQQGHSDYR